MDYQAEWERIHSVLFNYFQCGGVLHEEVMPDLLGRPLIEGVPAIAKKYLELKKQVEHYKKIAEARQGEFNDLRKRLKVPDCDWVTPYVRDALDELDKAKRALERAGFVDDGAQEWKPPIGWGNTGYLSQRLRELAEKLTVFQVDRDGWKAKCEHLEKVLAAKNDWLGVVLRERDEAQRQRDTPVGVPSVDPTPEQIEELAKVLFFAMHECTNRQRDWGKSTFKEDWIRAARAAFTHIGWVPVWFGPTRAEAEAAYSRLDWSDDSNLHAQLQSYRDWLLPLLPESAPVSVELDVTPVEAARAFQKARGDNCSDWQAVIDLCRSRIKPVYECQECAKKQTEMKARLDNLAAATYAIRAALEGE